jgi:hypothetical protein
MRFLGGNQDNLLEVLKHHLNQRKLSTATGSNEEMNSASTNHGFASSSTTSPKQVATSFNQNITSI